MMGSIGKDSGSIGEVARYGCVAFKFIGAVGLTLESEI
jgi:hypothetical protein